MICLNHRQPNLQQSLTGISGSGKSSVCEALKSEGRKAIDADWEGYSQFVDRITGEALVDPPYPAPPHWLEQFAWQIKVERVASVAMASGVTFLCGYAENEQDVWPHFSRVVCLLIDDETLRRRLTMRETNAFGKHQDELDVAITRNQAMEAEYRGKGAILIDATRPLDEVVRAVLAAGDPAAAS